MTNFGTQLTVTDYLKIETDANTRYEYHDGMIVAMAGGTINHSRICGHAYWALRQGLMGDNSGCEVFNSEIKLYIEKGNRYLYPDAMVVCGPLETADELPDAITNPVVIVEVLSPGTANYDRGDKLHFYRQIPSLKMYILVEQEKQQIDVYTRKGDLWQITRVDEAAAYLDVAVLNVKIPLAELYRDVVFPEGGEESTES